MAENTIKESLEIVSNYIGSKVKDREPIFRINVMPEASSAYNGKIIQYLGRTTEYYIRGYFYKCTFLDDEYVWLRHDAQPNMSKGIVVSVPAISVGEYTYNGEEQGPTFLGLDPGRCTITNQKSINAGHHTMSITLKDATNMEWADGSTSPKTYDYDISKKSQIISVDSTNVEVNVDAPTKAISVNGVAGTLSAISSDSSIVATNVNGKNVSITGLKNGNATVTIMSPEDDNHFESNIIVIYVVADMLKVGSFGSLTDKQLVDLVAAADRGEIDLYEDAGWRVGDERRVTLSAMPAANVQETHVSQTVTLVLLDRGVYTLTNAVSSGRTKCSFVVGLKECLKERGKMNNADTTSGSWNSSIRRKWCNNEFKNSIPSSILPIFKQVRVITAGTYNGTTNQTTNDWFFLPAEKECHTPVSNSNATEANALSVLNHYQTDSNLTKKYNTTTTVAGWWTRSPHKSNAQCWVLRTEDGKWSGYKATSGLGLSPIGCI